MFKGFCGHKLHDVLTAPGTADLTADVDFSYLRRMAGGQVASLGPIKQQMFLKNMGIDVRLKVMIYFRIIKYFYFVVFHKNVSVIRSPSLSALLSQQALDTVVFLVVLGLVQLGCPGRGHCARPCSSTQASMKTLNSVHAQ